MTRARSFQLALLAMFAAIALSGCNTIEGFGKDVKKAGGELEEAAEEAKN
ncbi:MAG TPA: entericidin A/B family lipoprotein [Arenimonas sp.]|nr:entericidin A/B family lipoprotein [Arenimonas sp.]HEU0152453.1 entericidin A/B family lipoprotein [Arenimonas sp.]